MTIRLPQKLDDIHTMLNVINWRDLEAQVATEARSRLAIVGPVNSGKSSLFNALEGRDISTVSPVPGTTRETIHEAFGPFTLIDTPGFGEANGSDRSSIAQQAIQQADSVVLLLDAVSGLRQTDVDLYHQIKEMGKPVLVAFNKIDLIKDRDRVGILNDAEHKLGTDVIPVSAKTGEGIADQLMPAIIQLNPQIAVAVGRALPAYRRQAADRVIRSAAVIAGGIGLEPVPMLDIPLLLGHQLRMVLRIAAIYGEPFTMHHARELIGTIAGGAGLRFLGEQAAKFLPGPGWLVSAGFASGGTFAIGKAAQAYFESGKQLQPPQLKAIYKRLRNQPQDDPDDVKNP
ncbi:MAG: GTP-binding protein [Anaerolineae bacterium]|nr:GTP-binding protein [Anaerolineae bacterium]